MRASFVRPRMLTLITTHQCTAACDHCCFACSPKITKRIPRARLSALIEEAREIPSIRFLSFVGGEPFLLGAELDEHFAHAKRCGFAVGTTTNAYWAVGEEAARRRVGAATQSGLDVMFISTGEMHARFVPIDRVIHAARAACEYGLETTITIERFIGTTFDPKGIRDEPELRRLREEGRLTVFERDWVPHADGVGTARLTHDPKDSLFDPDAKRRGCTIVLDDLTVNPNLELLSCCGYPIESIPELALGSVRSITLLEALERAPDDALKLWLHVAGPERMLLAVKQKVPDYRLPLEAVHPCQACLHLHRDPVALSVLREAAPGYAATLEKMYDAISDIRFAKLTPDAQR